MEILDATQEKRELLHLVHETNYTYSNVVQFSPHRLVLRPREGHDIRLHSMVLETWPKSEVHWYRDILDNVIAEATFLEPADSLKIRSEFVIGLPIIPAGPPQPVPVEFPSQVPGIDELVAVPYRQFTYPPEVAKLRQWYAMSGLSPGLGERRAMFDDLAAYIYKVISYTRREEPGVQSPVQTLELGSGSCRDMAVLMIETCRSLGYPARFVSGYLESSNSKVGRGSTHAWTEIYLPDKGWTGYDPSIGHRAGVGHVPVGVSHHPRGVMPVTGGYNGPPGTRTSLSISITTQRLQR